jgi:hypothetical protein
LSKAFFRSDQKVCLKATALVARKDTRGGLDLTTIAMFTSCRSRMFIASSFL